MLGYIKVYKPELRIKEYEMYKSIYCTLCKRLGKDYGILSRFTLSYDFTFLALLKISLNDREINTVRKSCPFNPLKKCNYCTENTDVFDFAAATAQIMLYYKFNDNVIDEKGLKKIAYKLLRLIFSAAHKKAAQKFPDIENAVKNYILSQSRLEKEDCASLDISAEPTALVISKIFMMCSDDYKQKRVLERLGYCIGRYTYLMDALEDLEQDKKKNRFNPLKNREDSRLVAQNQIYATINEAKSAFELLDIQKFKNILGNIIYIGLEDTLQKEINK